jgi:galactonate dehydratase
VLTAAISAIDLALHDIAGKALGVPVYQLLGGRQRDFVPCFASTSAATYPQLVENVKQLIERGWPAIRVGMATYDTGGDPALFEPRESIALTAEWLTGLRAEVGPGPVLGIDYHHRLSVAEAASFCQRMPSGTLDFLEEPIRAESPDAYRVLRTMVDVPFAIGEEFSSKWAFMPFIEQGLTNFARVDICNVGGFTEAIKVAGLAEAHYVDLMPHDPLGPICTAASIHLAAAVPNFAWLEAWAAPAGYGSTRDEDALFPVRPALEGARYPVPETPGLGVEFNEDIVAEFRYWEPMRLHRRDGSYTNW